MPMGLESCDKFIVGRVRITGKNFVHSIVGQEPSTTGCIVSELVISELLPVFRDS
ncbi:hypothetical protein D3C81_2030500 [compost metagenome]